MGFLVLLPPPKMTMRRDGVVTDLTQHMAAYGWLCLYCHTVQPASRDDCCNCGASKPDIQEAADWVAARMWKAQGQGE
jgi:hypothetical protein